MKKPRKQNADRTTISIPPSIYQKALEIMKARDFPDFSGLLHQLIREEYERRIDRETWIVEIIATAIGKPAEEVRALIDARMPQAERELKREGRKGRAKGSTTPAL